MIDFPNINPIALSLGPLDIRWYSLAYIAGFFGALEYMKWIVKKHPIKNITPNIIESLFIWMVLSVILGGRLGYVLFYNFGYFSENPAEILKIWSGGMSFHGGMIAVILALALFSKLKNIHIADLGDRMLPGICIGLFTGRLANFVNGELYGRATDVPWAMIFPHDALQLPRHPSQLYEALLEGLLLFFLLHFLNLKSVVRYRVSGAFLLVYGIARFGIEYVRQPDSLAHLQGGIYTYITQGQILSLPMVVAGLYLLWLSAAHEANAATGNSKA